MIMIARRFSLLRQLVWAATLATGFGTLWFALLLWLGTSIQAAWQGGTQPPQERRLVRSDGTLMIQIIPPQNLSLATYRDLQGRPLDAPDKDDLLPAVYVSGEHRTANFLSSRAGWDQRLLVFVNEREPTVNWFFVHDGKPDGAGYFVGYERSTNRRVGYIGMSGFRTDPVPAADWIAVRGEPKSSTPFLSIYIYSGRAWLRPGRWDVPPRLVYMPSGNHLRMVDLAARTVVNVFESREPIVAVGVPWLAPWSTGHATKEQPILVRTTQQIHVLDQKHHVIKVFTIPTEVDRRSPVQWYEIGNGQAIAVFDRVSSTGEPGNVSKQMVCRIANDGAIQDQFELDLRTGSSVPSKQTQAVELALGIPAPAILFVVELLRVIWTDQMQSYPVTLAALLKNSGPSLIAILALALILAEMARRRSRAFGLSRPEQFAWAVFVLLLGLPAYVGFLLYRRWPIRQLCPNCHAQVPRDRVACAECGTRFPDPALEGIEIFA
jgi:hypothetical protein